MTLFSACLGRRVDGFWTRRPGFKSRVILTGSVVHKATLDQVSSKWFSYSLPFTIPQLLATRICPRAGRVESFEEEVPTNLDPLHSFTSLPRNSHYHGHLPTSKLSSPNPQNHLCYSGVTKLQYIWVYRHANHLLAFYWHRKWKYSWTIRLASTPTFLQPTKGLIKGSVYFSAHVKPDRQYKMFTILWTVPIITVGVPSVSCEELVNSC